MQQPHNLYGLRELVYKNYISFLPAVSVIGASCMKLCFASTGSFADVLDFHVKCEICFFF